MKLSEMKKILDNPPVENFWLTYGKEYQSKWYILPMTIHQAQIFADTMLDKGYLFLMTREHSDQYWKSNH